MGCDECRDNLTAYLEGELSAEDQRRLRDHLSECPECARELEQLRTLVAVLHGMPEVEPPSSLRAELRAIPRRGSTGPRNALWTRGRTVIAAFAAAAAAALLLWTGITLYTGTEALPGGQYRTEEMAAESREGLRADGPLAAAGAETADAEAGEEGAPPADTGAEDSETVVAAEPRAVDADVPSSSSGPTGREDDRPPVPGPSAQEDRPSAPGPAIADTGAGAPSQDAETPDVASGAVGMETEPAPMPPPRGAMAESVEKEASAPEALSVPRRVPGMVGPLGSRGPAAAPTAIRELLPMPEPRYLDASSGQVAVAPPNEGTPFTITITPPRSRPVGEVVPATIAIEPEGDVARAVVDVETSEGLELIGTARDGRLFDGALVGNEKTVLTVRMQAERAGRHQMRLRLRSTDPVVDTRLTVRLGEFRAETPPASRQVTFSFDGVPLRDAMAEITRQSNLQIEVADECADRTVTIAAPDPVPAAAAVRSIAETVGCEAREADGGITIGPAE